MNEEERTKLFTREQLRNFLIELILYGILVGVYFYVVLRLLDVYFADLFANNLTGYAILGLVVIVAQGALLDVVTSFLLDQIKLKRLE